MPFSIDELNVFQPEKKKRSKNRSVPYKRYFGEMLLTNAEVKYRIRLAKALEGAFGHLFDFMSAQKEVGDPFDTLFLIAMTVQWVRDAIEGFGIDLDGISYLPRYIEELSQEVVEATIKNIDDSYYLSDDRAKYIAENEANTIQNGVDFGTAVAEGKTEKTWHTMEDRYVRPTHADVDGVTIPIDEPFHVGNSLMMYPKDWETFEAGAEEICNCRCSVTYS